MRARPAVRQLGRLSEIGQAAARHGFGYVVETRGPFRRRRSAAAEGSSRGQRLRELLDELGPTFVKFGQLLSTRPDLVPPDIVLELRGLQDDVRPFPFAEVEAVLELELGLGVERLFLELEPKPVAAASIGQVHRAVLPNGDRVAVKVQRPQAPRQIEADLELLYQAARLVRQRVRALRFIDTTAIVDEFARSIRQELDYRAEGRNAERFSRDFRGHPTVRIPGFYRGYSGARVLTLEYLEGVQVADLDPSALELDERRRLAYGIAEAWMTMIFRHGFFHGDPHPANILVTRDGRLGLVDFGQAGKLSADDMEKLTALFIDAAGENVAALPRRLAELGVQYGRGQEQEFVAELREVYDRYYGTRLADIDPLQVIREAFALIYRMNLRLPARFVLLDKAIATLGAVGVELYPDFNVFEVARPYARELMMERFRPARLAARLRQEVRAYGRTVAVTPRQVSALVDELRDGEVEVGFRNRGLEALAHRLDPVVNRLAVAIVGAAGVVGSAILASFGGELLRAVAVAGFVLSLLLGFWLAWGIVRSGRL
ncbi:MAG: AarF/ABC1/UbiB kinase family protein [Thermoleophilia bacterium]|nr:AarF/ABC1/UbiB kinase family protein [Thermoleophilia bacterium]